MQVKDLFNWRSKKSYDSNQITNVPTNVVYAMPYYQMSTNLPVFYDFVNDYKLLEVYEKNPIVSTVINIKSQAYANGVIKAIDLKTKQVISDISASDNKTLQNLSKILFNPNPLQSRKELFEQFKISQAVFGNGYLHGLFADYGNPCDSISAFNILPPYLIQHKITGKFFNQTDINDVITEIAVQLTPGNILKYTPAQILHRKDTNLTVDQLFFRGKSKLLALAKPISNIDAALESINVLMRNRGAVGFYSNMDKDANGTMPLTESEEESLNEKFKNYGTLEGQQRYIFTKRPLTFQRTALTPEELGIYKEIQTSAIIISNAYGVPPELTKTYVEGATFENQLQSVRRLYQDTIIPEANDDFEAINKWLRCEEKGFKLFIDFSHLPALQENQKEKAMANSLNEKTYMSAFMKGAINYNVYLNSIGLEKDELLGEKRIWDLAPEQLNIITGKFNPQPITTTV